MAIVGSHVGIGRKEYSVGDIIPVPEGTELNFGLAEDSDSITAEVSQTAVALGRRANGAIRVSLTLNPNLQPLFYHQPELKVGLR